MTNQSMLLSQGSKITNQSLADDLGFTSNLTKGTSQNISKTVSLFSTGISSLYGQLVDDGALFSAIGNTELRLHNKSLVFIILFISQFHLSLARALIGIWQC